MTASLNLAVIPARGGSKRVPKKNIRPLGGLPLIAYTISAARESGLFADVVVSTDSAEIAEAATTHGATVPFLRDGSLADDITPVSAVTADVLDRLDPGNSRYRHVCQLMPNCPLRDGNDVADSYRQFTNSGSGAQISLVRYGWQNPWWAMKMDPGGALNPVFPEALLSRSQDLDDLYCPTGAIWWIQAEVLRRERTFHVAGRTGHVISWQHGVDIDTEDDWAMAEMLFRLERERR